MDPETSESAQTQELRAPRELFELPDTVVYLNCAAFPPRLHAVAKAGHEAVDRMGAPWNIHGGNFFDEMTKLRQLFASLIGAQDSTVALVPAVSYGVAVAARNIPIEAGDNVVVVAREFPSNYYSWSRVSRERGAGLRVADSGADVSLTESIIALIDRRTAVVAVPQCHWTDGTIIDLVRVGEMARRHDAALVVDASQSLGAYPIDVAEVQPDFLISVGYKWLLGPYSLSFMYVAERWHSVGVPLEESWLYRIGSENFTGLVERTEEYQGGAKRFGQGEASQFYLAPMAIAALAQVQAWKPVRIQAHLREWTNELAAQASGAGFSVADAAARVGHIVGLKARNGLPSHLLERLVERHIYVAVRGDKIRVSPHLHSKPDDIGHLLRAIKESIRV